MLRHAKTLTTVRRCHLRFDGCEASCRRLNTAATEVSSAHLFDTGEIGFAERVVLAEIVVPEPIAGS